MTFILIRLTSFFVLLFMLLQAHATVGGPAAPLWPWERVPGLHGGCHVETLAWDLPTPLACTALGPCQMTFDGHI